MRIELHTICSPMLIIPSRTGVIYENQTWGTNCYRDSLQGILIPISNDYNPENYEESLDYKITSLFQDGCSGYIDSTIAKKIEMIFEKFPETRGITINWKKLKESHEAWLHVIVQDREFASYSGLDNVDAILTWTNSD